MNRTLALILIFGFLNSYFGVAQSQDSIVKNTTNKKEGWSFGGVPAIAFDSDVGFRYGAILNVFNYGNGSAYPKYNESLYLEWSRTTKGNGTNQIIYDSKTLLKNIRTTAEFSYITENTLDFYGFNGYKAYYNPSFEDKNSSAYLSPLFYRMDRKYLRLRTDFQGALSGSTLQWLAGVTFYSVSLDTVDLTSLNKGRSDKDQYPATNGGLYEIYKKAGLLPSNELKGGNNYFIKTGIIYDTRDNEANPMHGVWSDVQVFAGLPGLDNGNGFVQLAFTHRQYFTLVQKKLSLACRLSAQNKVAGNIPFYLLPFEHYLTPYVDVDGLGGIKTLRGILRNRVVGNGVAYGNLEMRWKFLQTILFKQNLYLALSAFVDGGMVTQQYKLNYTSDVDAQNVLDKGSAEQLHVSTGLGFHVALNENFIISADYGKAFDKRDGTSGLYIGIGFLY